MPQYQSSDQDHSVPQDLDVVVRLPYAEEKLQSSEIVQFLTDLRTGLRSRGGDNDIHASAAAICQLHELLNHSSAFSIREAIHQFNALPRFRVGHVAPCFIEAVASLVNRLDADFDNSNWVDSPSRLVLSFLVDRIPKLELLGKVTVEEQKRIEEIKFEAQLALAKHMALRVNVLGERAQFHALDGYEHSPVRMFEQIAAELAEREEGCRSPQFIEIGESLLHLLNTLEREARIRFPATALSTIDWVEKSIESNPNHARVRIVKQEVEVARNWLGKSSDPHAPTLLLQQIEHEANRIVCSIADFDARGARQRYISILDAVSEYESREGPGFLGAYSAHILLNLATLELRVDDPIIAWQWLVEARDLIEEFAGAQRQNLEARLISLSAKVPPEFRG